MIFLPVNDGRMIGLNAVTGATMSSRTGFRIDR